MTLHAAHNEQMVDYSFVSRTDRMLRYPTVYVIERVLDLARPCEFSYIGRQYTDDRPQTSGPIRSALRTYLEFAAARRTG